MEYTNIGRLGSVNGLDAGTQNREGEVGRIRSVLHLLIGNKILFTKIVERLRESPLVKPEDKEGLVAMSEAVGHGREATELAHLGQERPTLVALLVAYAVYEYTGA